MRRFLVLFAILAIALIGGPRDSEAVPLPSNVGWVEGSVSDLDAKLRYDFTLGTSGYLSVSDCCSAGVLWGFSFTNVSEGSGILGNTRFGLESFTGLPTGMGAAQYDAWWLNPDFSHLQFLLDPGIYVLILEDPDANSFPREIGVRLDTTTVPLPGAALLLLGGLGLLGLQRRRKPA